MLTREDKEVLLRALTMIDVKDMEIDHENPEIVKWFRFGNYNAIQIVAEIIKQLPEKTP